MVVGNKKRKKKKEPKNPSRTNLENVVIGHNLCMCNGNI